MSNCQKCQNSKIHIICTQCDQNLCSVCDYQVHFNHTSNQMNIGQSTSQVVKQHQRWSPCEECSDMPAKSYCPECKQLMCGKCDQMLHRGGTRRQHVRQIVDEPRFIVPKHFSSARPSPNNSASQAVQGGTQQQKLIKEGQSNNQAFQLQQSSIVTVVSQPQTSSKPQTFNEVKKSLNRKPPIKVRNNQGSENQQVFVRDLGTSDQKVQQQPVNGLNQDEGTQYISQTNAQLKNKHKPMAVTAYEPINPQSSSFKAPPSSTAGITSINAQATSDIDFYSSPQVVSRVNNNASTKNHPSANAVIASSTMTAPQYDNNFPNSASNNPVNGGAWTSGSGGYIRNNKNVAYGGFLSSQEKAMSVPQQPQVPLEHQNELISAGIDDDYCGSLMGGMSSDAMPLQLSGSKTGDSRGADNNDLMYDSLLDEQPYLDQAHNDKHLHPAAAGQYRSGRPSTSANNPNTNDDGDQSNAQYDRPRHFDYFEANPIRARHQTQNGLGQKMPQKMFSSEQSSKGPHLRQPVRCKPKSHCSSSFSSSNCSGDNIQYINPNSNGSGSMASSTLNPHHHQQHQQANSYTYKPKHKNQRNCSNNSQRIIYQPPGNDNPSLDKIKISDRMPSTGKKASRHKKNSSDFTSNSNPKNINNNSSNHGGSQHQQQPNTARTEIANMPLLQPLITDLTPEVAKLQKYLRLQASQGQLLLPVQMILRQFNGGLAQDTINKALQKEIIHQTVRKFAQLEPMTFISLNLRILSMESLSWVLSSLCADEMTPNETTVKNRIKEAFALKVDQSLWNAVIRNIQEEQGANNTNDESISYQSSFAEPIIDTGSSIPPQTQFNHKKFSFKLLPAPEAQSDFQDQFLLYHKNEPQWTGVDSELSISHIEPGLYEITKEFLREYFSQKQSSVVQACKNSTEQQQLAPGEDSITSAEPQIDWIDENTRAIPGGRYGCTQYLKFCGPEDIRELTVGRISLMVKQLIKDDWLRHHKTLLVWSAAVDKHKAAELEQQSHQAQDPEDQVQAAQKAVKLKQVKQALIEILAESKQGMSLAQLPQNLNKKLDFGFNPNELGFAKLKDLIQSMDKQIKLDLKGQNHPFAYLIKKYEKQNNKSEIQIPRKDIIFEKQANLSQATIMNVAHIQLSVISSRQSIENIMNAFMNLMKEYPQGIKSFELNRLVSGKIGSSFSHKDLNCNSELEFIKKYIQPAFDIELLYVDNQFGGTDRNAESRDDDNYFVVRSTQYYRQMMMCQQQHLAMVYQNLYPHGQQNLPYDSQSQMQQIHSMQIQNQQMEPGRFSFGSKVQEQLNRQNKQIPTGAPLEHLVYNHMDDLNSSLANHHQSEHESLPIPNTSPRMMQNSQQQLTQAQLQSMSDNNNNGSGHFIPTTETQYDEKSIFGISDLELSNISKHKHAFDHHSMWAESLFMQPNTFMGNNTTSGGNMSCTDTPNLPLESECHSFIQRQLLPDPATHGGNPHDNENREGTNDFNFQALLVSPQTTQERRPRPHDSQSAVADNGRFHSLVQHNGSANNYANQANDILSYEGECSVVNQSLYTEPIPQFTKTTSSQHKVNITEMNALSEEGPSPQKLQTPFASTSSQGSTNEQVQPQQMHLVGIAGVTGMKNGEPRTFNEQNNRITEVSNESCQSNPSPRHSERFDLS